METRNDYDHFTEILDQAQMAVDDVKKLQKELQDKLDNNKNLSELEKEKIEEKLQLSKQITEDIYEKLYQIINMNTNTKIAQQSITKIKNAKRGEQWGNLDDEQRKVASKHYKDAKKIINENISDANKRLDYILKSCKKCKHLQDDVRNALQPRESLRSSQVLLKKPSRRPSMRTSKSLYVGEEIKIKPEKKKGHRIGLLDTPEHSIEDSPLDSKDMKERKGSQSSRPIRKNSDFLSVSSDYDAADKTPAKWEKTFSRTVTANEDPKNIKININIKKIGSNRTSARTVRNLQATPTLFPDIPESPKSPKSLRTLRREKKGEMILQLQSPPRRK